MLASPPPPYDFPSITVKEKQLSVYSPPKDLFDRQPAELVDVAISRLQAAGVELIEWRALLYRRMSVPIFVKDFSYVVPDEDLATASDILSSIGLPLSPPSKLLTRVEGDIHTKATYHRLTRSSAPAWLQCLVLYPASFVSLNPEELDTTPSIHLLPSPSTTKILVPRPSAVYAWLLRTMLKYPRSCAVRTILASDLSELVDYHLLRVVEGYVNPDENPERWKELNMKRRIADALELINQWTQNHEWREGEEWFGDALEAIVSGDGNIEYLPSSNS
ncbi:hypothetical protein H1R20_g8904, partial [Candolleomyces eurysporus]